MILEKETLSKSRKTLTGIRMFLLICCLFIALVPLRAHATTGSDYDFNDKYRWTVYWHVDNSYDASENVLSLYTYYPSNDSDVRNENLSVEGVYTGDRDSHHHPAYDIPYMASDSGSHTTTMNTNSPPMGFRYDIHGKGGNNVRWYLDKVEVEVIDPVPGTDIPTKRTMWTGCIGARNGHVGGSTTSLELWYDVNPPEFGGWSNKDTTDETARTDSYDSGMCGRPYIAGVSDISIDDSVNVPADGKELYIEMNPGILYDNLGAKWHLQQFDITTDRPDKHTDIDYKDGKWYLVLHPDSNASEDYTVTINQDVYGGESHPTSKSVTVHTFDYHYEFVDEQGQLISEEFVDYGAEVPKPELPEGRSARYKCDDFADWENTTTGPRDRTVRVYQITDTLNGSGTEDDPYQICNMEDWEHMRRDVENGVTDKYYSLNANLHIEEVVGTREHPFSLNLDGNGRALDVLIDSNDDVQAPFAYVRSATIKNLTVTGSVRGNEYVGGLIGVNLDPVDSENDKGTIISCCNVYADVSGYKHIGGFAAGYYSSAGIGANAKLTIRRSSFKGKISGDNSIGGFVGYGIKGTNLLNCLFDPESAETNNPEFTATFVHNTYGTLRDCIYTEPFGYVQGQVITDYKFVFRDSNGKKFDEQIVHQGEQPRLPLSDGDKKIVSWKCRECEDWNDTTNGIVKRNMIATFSTDAPFKGSGTESDPYEISSDDDWHSLNLRVMNYTPADDEFFRMTADISTDEMIGSVYNPFSGTFDGQMHTLNVTIQNDDSNVRTAPFVFVHNGTVKNLRVTGSVTGDEHWAGGLVGDTNGTTNISDVIVSAEVSGSDNIGGVVAANYGYLTITDSTYNGKINCNTGSGFVAYDTGNYWDDESECVHIYGCLFDPAEGSGYGLAGDAFALESYGIVNDCYYTALWEDAAMGSFGINGISFDKMYVGGDESNPFTLQGHGSYGLESLRLLTERGRTKGVYFRQDTYMKAFTPIGDENHPFEGTFDGNGYTLEAGFNNIEDPVAAPFGRIDNATIKRVTVTGQVHAQRCAGLVLDSSGESLIDQCVIYADIKGKDTVGGYVSQTKDSLCISYSNFEGTINGENNCGGFIANSAAGTHIYDNYFMPSGSSTCLSGSTFIEGKYRTLNYCYYTVPFGKAQGMQLYRGSDEKDYKALLNVVKLISKLPDPASMTLADKEKIQNARKAYDALTDKQKKELTEEFLQELVKAEEQIKKLEKEFPEKYKKAVEEAKKLKVKKFKAKAKKGNKASISWKKNKKADGYEIAWSTTKTFTKKTTKTRQFTKEEANKATIKKTIKKLKKNRKGKKGRTYYFRIRTYNFLTNYVDMKTYKVYGKWSKKKSITVKK